MAVTKDQIMGALPRLNKADLQAIQALASTLLAQASGVADRPDGPAGWLAEALLQALPTTQRHAAKAPRTVAAFNKQAPVFLDFVNKHFRVSMNKKITAVTLMRLLVALIMSDLKQRGVPVSYGTVAMHLQRISEVFESAFPDYLESGLGHLVFSVATKQYPETQRS